MSRAILQHCIGLALVGGGLWALFGLKVFAVFAVVAGLALMIDARRGRS